MEAIRDIKLEFLEAEINELVDKFSFSEIVALVSNFSLAEIVVLLDDFSFMLQGAIADCSIHSFSLML